MPKTSAGILLYRRRDGSVEVLLLHPGGPIWAKKDDDVWTIPKGLVEADETPLATACREFREETGAEPPRDAFELGAFRQPDGKTIVALAAEGDFDPASLESNMFTIEWPPRSGKQAQFPEADRALWFSPPDALVKATKGQKPILAALGRKLGFEPA
jgi:predicted NUDIX family NTP pyrophosphohydrolase